MGSEKLIILLATVVSCFVSIKSDQTCSKFSPNYKTISPSGDCSKYLECYQGELKEKKCMWLQHFSPSKSYCTLWTVNCKEQPAPVPKEWWAADNKNICEGRPDFKINSPWGYREYFKCEKGKLSLEKCPWNYPVFDPNPQDCYNYFHKWNNVETPLPEKISTSTISISTTSSSSTSSTGSSSTSSSSTSSTKSTGSSSTSSSPTSSTKSTGSSSTSSSSTSTGTSSTSPSSTKPTQSTQTPTTKSTTTTQKTTTEDAETTTEATEAPKSTGW